MHLGEHHDGRFDCFVDAVTAGQYKPTARAQRDFIAGILQSRSTVIAKIARSLNEDLRLIHTEKRLCSRLGSDRYSDHKLLDGYLRLVAPLLSDTDFRRPTIACDVTDIGKPWAAKMGHLARVRDGSSPVKRYNDQGQLEAVIHSGFEMLSIEAVGERARRLPLYAKLFSTAEPGWLGFRPLLRHAILKVKPHVPGDCIWSFDRGHDAYETLSTIAGTGIDFVSRMKMGVRENIWGNGVKMKVDELIPQVTMRTSFRVRKYANGNNKKKVWDVQAGWVEEVRLPAQSSGPAAGRSPGKLRLSMVVTTSNFSTKPMVLLTNMKVRSAKDAREVVDAYHERWGSEEGFRFMKTELGLEEMRALKWISLQRLAVLAMLAYGYLAYLVHTAREAVRTAARRFKAFGPVPEYLFYRMLDGVRTFIWQKPAVPVQGA